ncbi:MAG: hypothetical protein M3Z26_15290 [Bacteroidota bacterium]|nr:hypothetical protein [Bacteroidota bacterium]
MDQQKRLSNEKQFEEWIEKIDGGRIYSFQISGKHGWIAKYLKETDADETTLKFWQEIYDHKNNLIEIHQKYPIDTGHKKIKIE